MIVYLINIILTAFIAYFAQSTAHVKIKGNLMIKKIHPFYVVLLLFLWCSIFALRDKAIGSDTSGYYFFYNRIEYYQSLSEFVINQRDQLFGVLEYLCFHLSKGNWIVFQYVCSLIIYLPILIVFSKRPNTFLYSAILYIFTCSFYSGYNGLRQTIAISLVVFAYYVFFCEKKYIRYFLFMLLAFGFHSTALIALPIHFLSSINYKSKYMIVIYSAIILSYFFLWNVWTYLIDFLELIGQSKIAEDYADVTANGSSVLRLLVYGMPLIIIFIHNSMNKISKKDLFDNGDIVQCIFSVLMMMLSTKLWLFGRVSGYFAISNIFLISNLEECVEIRGRKIFNFIMFALYFIFMLLIILSGEGNIYPYIFT